MTLYRISLRPARNPGAAPLSPAASAIEGYTLIAPLTAEGQLDIQAWRDNRQACKVVRLENDPADNAHGHLTHRGNRWFFLYEGDHDGEEEHVWRLAEHQMKEGAYLTVDLHGETALTYKIIDISPA